CFVFFLSSSSRHTRSKRDWSSDVCSSDLRIAEVRPQVSGIIQKRLFAEGSEVKAGQQLYQIDPATYQATLKSAEASHLAADTLRSEERRVGKEERSRSWTAA